MAKEFRCRVDGCAHTDDAAHKIAAHTRSEHPDVYAARKAERAARRDNQGGGVSEDEPEDDGVDPETSLLYAANALFADNPLERDGYARVTEYLRTRYAPHGEAAA
jgi:hypothetical protein